MKIITFRANNEDLKIIEYIKKFGFPAGFKTNTSDVIRMSITYQALGIGYNINNPGIYKQQKDSSSI